MTPYCAACGTPLTHVRDERYAGKSGRGRVELYRCPECRAGGERALDGDRVLNHVGPALDPYHGNREARSLIAAQNQEGSR